MATAVEERLGNRAESAIPVCYQIALLFAQKDRLSCVLRRHRFDEISKNRLALAAPYHTHVPKIVAAICFNRFDLYVIVGGHKAVPMQPQFPAIGHGVGPFNV